MDSNADEEGVDVRSFLDDLGGEFEGLRTVGDSASELLNCSKNCLKDN